MENRKLVPMSDYVLALSESTNYKEYNQLNEDFVNSVVNYAKFIKQKPKVGMFVPSDEDDFPIYAQVISRGENIINKEEVEKYNKAKERVLFDGFFLEDCFLCYNSNRGKRLLVSINDLYYLDTIEELLDLAALYLTENAIKQIGL